MLVLSRKAGEKVVIAGDITVTITRVAGGRVTLGIEAPAHVRVVRGELGAKSAPVEASGGGSNEAAAPSDLPIGSAPETAGPAAPVGRPASIERRMGRGRFVVGGQVAAN